MNAYFLVESTTCGRGRDPLGQPVSETSSDSPVESETSDSSPSECECECECPPWECACACACACSPWECACAWFAGGFSPSFAPCECECVCPSRTSARLVVRIARRSRRNEDHDIDADPLGRARGDRADAISPYIAARAASSGSRVVAAIVSAHERVSETETSERNNERASCLVLRQLSMSNDFHFPVLQTADSLLEAKQIPISTRNLASRREFSTATGLQVCQLFCENL